MADCWKLCSSPDPPAQYMTLSYRWGVQPGTMLLRRNFDDFHRDTPISILPQTFQDAITVARAFSVAYIWIDALCIIQDSDTDWELEAPTMRYVYSHSACNIAASAAADQHSGLFRTRHGESVLPGFFKSGTTSTNHGTDRFLIFDKGYWSRYLNCGALHSRGWVFQECLLAPRVVYFAEDQILWECLIGNKCEGFPEGIPYHQRTKDLSPLWDSLENDVDRQIYGTSKQMSYKIHTLWSNLVERYSSCDLTFSKDKLPALSGVAQVFASATGDKYAYGMWHSRIVEQLLWRVATPNPGRSLPQSKVPSWSWASLDGTIEMTPIPISWKSLVEIVEIKHTNMFAESSSQSSNPSLRLKGALSVLGESGTKDHSSIRLGSLRLGCDISPDYHHVHDDRSSHAVYFLPTLSAHPWYPAKRFTTQVVGLVLASQGQNTPVKFHRVGLFSTDRSHDIERLGLTITPEGLATLKRLEHQQEIEII
ncbi:heterokaryon incompatibility protein [Fusarium proliferatum]|uniref:Heterokaryon incompatibility protein n=1 Tax=Gibberella intermedia TaxID=948311 RepID=A0A365MVS4_GIBIN|nr:heterokaryon incompatibility protein [Fusarium proliferatum]